MILCLDKEDIVGDLRVRAMEKNSVPVLVKLVDTCTKVDVESPSKLLERQRREVTGTCEIARIDH